MMTEPKPAISSEVEASYGPAMSALSEMQRAFVLNVPLTVDVGIGKNWKEAKG